MLIGFLVLLAAGDVARADKRVALVIGNASYQNTPGLANPENDAQDMAAALTRVGFDVIFERDLDKRGMEQALARFARAASDSDAALFYYAGHGMQYRGRNYLMPIDARLEDEFSLEFEMTRLDDVMQVIGRSRGVKVVVLDACRRNPLAERLAGLSTTRDFIATRGLARIDSNRGMVLVYSTQADQVAVDGPGRNSPFTTALLKEINEPGLEIGTLFRRVAAAVNKATDGRQLPEVSLSLLGEFYLNRADTDVQAWSKVRGSQDVAELRQFLARYPNSPLVADVRERIEAIERAARARLEQEQADRLERERLAQEAERLRQELAERDRLAAEQKARLEEERKRAAAEEQAKLEEERKRTAQQPAIADKPLANATQTALVSPPPAPPVQQPAPSVLTGSALIVEIKRQLQRVGCYAGPLNDRWSSDAKTSVAKFARYASAPAGKEATNDLLQAIRAKLERVCPLECTAGKIEKDGQCVAARTKSSPRSKKVASQSYVTCGRRGCQTVPKGCYAVRGAGGHGLGGKIVCP